MAYLTKWQLTKWRNFEPTRPWVFTGEPELFKTGYSETSILCQMGLWCFISLSLVLKQPAMFSKVGRSELSFPTSSQTPLGSMSRVQKSSRLTKVWVHDEWYDMKKKIIKHKTHKRGSSHFSISIFCCIRKKILRDFCWDTISFLGQGNIIVVDWNNNFRLILCTLSLVHHKISRLGSSMKKVVDHRGIC